MPDYSESWTQTVDSLFTSTWAYRKGPATEQAFQKTPFIFWLREKGRIQYVSGHTRIEIPLEYGSNDTVRWLTKGSTVPMTDSELFTIAYEDWKYVAVNIIRWFTDDQKNRGKAQIINLVNAKLNAAERSLWEEFERVMFADGAGTNEPNGIQNLISVTPTTGTVHGINRATTGREYWRNTQKTATGSASVYLLSDMRNLMNTLTTYNKVEANDIAIVTNQTVFELYEDVHMDMKILTNTKLADAGFESFMFKGRPMMWCPSAPSGNMYFVNTNYLKLVCDEGFWMEMTDWKSIPDQPFDKVAQILCTCNLVTSRPIAMGVLSSIAA